MFNIPKSVFKSLSECASTDATKPILNTVFYNGTGYCATNGLIATVYQSDKNRSFSIDKDNAHIAYGYNQKAECYTLAETRKLGRTSNAYSLNSRDPKNFDRGTSLLPSCYPNMSQLIPCKGFSDKEIVFNNSTIEPVAMFANQKNISWFSLFIDLNTDELVYVPTVRLDADTIQRYTLRLKLANVPDTLKLKTEEKSVVYLFSVDAGHLIDAWNMCNEIPGETKLHLEFTGDKTPMRFDANLKNKAMMHTYGAIMPFQVKDLASLADSVGLQLGNKKLEYLAIA